MKLRSVVSWKSLPVKPPTMLTVVAGLVLDRVHAPSWVWGVTATVVAFLWIGFVISVFNEEQKDIFKDS